MGEETSLSLFFFGLTGGPSKNIGEVGASEISEPSGLNKEIGGAKGGGLPV